MKRSILFSLTPLSPLKRPCKNRKKQIPSLSAAIETISSNMSNYCNCNVETTPSKYINVSKEEKMLISKYMLSNKSNHFQPQETDTQISISNITYSNPFNSLDVIKKNQKIYKKVTKQLEEQQINLYHQKMKSININTFSHKSRKFKIRISQIFPTENTEISKNQNEREEDTKTFIPSLTSSSRKLYAYYCYPYKNFPEVREHCTMTQYGNCYYLIGGIGSIISSSNSLWKLDMKTLSWIKLTNSNFEQIPQNRFGHTSICYQNILYVIGGRTKYLHSYIFSDFDFFDLTKSKFVDRPHLDRDRWQFSSGEEGKVLNNTFIITLPQCKMLSCQVDIDYPGPFLYGHCEALAIPKDSLVNPRTTIYKIPDVPFGKRINLKLKEKGWYIFGGKEQCGVIQNTLLFLTIDERPLKWCVVETNGLNPIPRYDATLNFYEKGNALILFGGRNDEISDTYALNDLFFFDLLTFDWIKIELYNNDDPSFSVIHRCGHCTLLFDDKIVIFGGMNS